ncbi:hypothetical protein LX32DRAFT_699423 [Colletotrichum zoysiae]|uniref:Uncharacterized protein n=1 Tax=Colletotrichum zoysiae TaxID=1216348 RepID=A0AAD9H2V7_9PEZI|nr:hypothetical protein LX32DRAFT_699423 [Colletotrichum zoysiae]
MTRMASTRTRPAGGRSYAAGLAPSLWQIDEERPQPTASRSAFVHASVCAQSRGSMFTGNGPHVFGPPPSRGPCQPVEASTAPLPTRERYLRTGGGTAVTEQRPDFRPLK